MTKWHCFGNDPTLVLGVQIELAIFREIGDCLDNGLIDLQFAIFFLKKEFPIDHVVNFRGD